MMGSAVRARLAVSRSFSCWVAHIPAVKTEHGLSDERRGLVLLSMAVGSVVALPLAAWVLARWGSRRITSAAAVGFCLALPLPIMAPTTWLVLESLALLGAFNALLDVAMNAQALAVEACYQRPIMSTFHALFSVGGVAGALVASGFMARGVGSLSHVIAVTVLTLAVLVAAIPRLSRTTAAERT